MSSQAGFLKTRSFPAVAALLLALLAGCVISPRRDGTGTTTTPPPGGTNPGKLYVTNEANNTILRFDNALTATGDQTPAATLNNTSQISSPQYLLIDSANNRLYVAVSNAVLVYDNASTQTGGAAASRVIQGVSSPTDLALDRVRDQLYVTDGFSILVFANASTANGTPTPARTINPLSGGSAFSVAAIFLDTGTDKLYVADSLNSAVNIYDGASILNGSVNAPRTLSGANTQLSNPQGLQVDALGRLIVANNRSGSITIYASAINVSGNIVPSATITSPAANMAGPSQIFLSTGNELYVADGTAGGIPIFSGVNSANGNITPARDIAGPHTTLSRANAGSATTARGVGLDPTR